MKRLSFLLVVLFCLQLPLAGADETPLSEGLVRVEGLTFRCPKCARQDDLSCVIPRDGRDTLVACDEAIEFLLRQRVEGAYDGLHPSAMELRTYLLGDNLPYSRRRASLELLFRAKNGQQEIITHAGSLYGLHGDVFEELINEGLASEEVLEQFWNMPLISRRSSARLRTIIAHAHPSFTFEKLFASLSTLDLLRDEEDLKTMAGLLKLLGSSWATDVELAQSVFRKCSTPIEVGNCEIDAIREKSAVVAGYFERVRTHLTLRLISQKETAPDTVLATIARLPYQRVRTPDMLELILEAVVGLENDRGYWQGASKAVLKMLADVGQHDDQLASLLHALIKDEDVVKTLERVEMVEDFEIYRTGHSDVYVRARLGSSTNVEQSRKLNILLLVFGCAALSVFLSYVYHRHFAVSRTGGAEHPLSTEERAELRALRKYFKIAPGARDAELTKRFRVLARRYHPDVDGGSNHDFTELGEKYNRAQELLKRLNSA